MSESIFTMLLAQHDRSFSHEAPSAVSRTELTRSAEQVLRDSGVAPDELDTAVRHLLIDLLSEKIERDAAVKFSASVRPPGRPRNSLVRASIQLAALGKFADVGAGEARKRAAKLLGWPATPRTIGRARSDALKRSTELIAAAGRNQDPHEFVEMRVAEMRDHLDALIEQRVAERQRIGLQRAHPSVAQHYRQSRAPMKV